MAAQTSTQNKTLTKVITGLADAADIASSITIYAVIFSFAAGLLSIHFYGEVAAHIVRPLMAIVLLAFAVTIAAIAIAKALTKK